MPLTKISIENQWHHNFLGNFYRIKKTQFTHSFKTNLIHIFIILLLHTFASFYFDNNLYHIKKSYLISTTFWVQCACCLILIRVNNFHILHSHKTSKQKQHFSHIFNKDTPGHPVKYWINKKWNKIWSKKGPKVSQIPINSL